MLYLTCTTITSVDLAHYGVSRAKDWKSVDCGTIIIIIIFDLAMHRMWEILNTFHLYCLKKFKIIIYKVGILV